MVYKLTSWKLDKYSTEIDFKGYTRGKGIEKRNKPDVLPLRKNLLAHEVRFHTTAEQKKIN